MPGTGWNRKFSTVVSEEKGRKSFASLACDVRSWLSLVHGGCYEDRGLKIFPFRVEFSLLELALAEDDFKSQSAFKTI